MTNSMSTVPSSQAALNQWLEDSQIWENLKEAIASSSGFQRWQLERQDNQAGKQTNLDQQVQAYLRETLETLAY